MRHTVVLLAALGIFGSACGWTQPPAKKSLIGTVAGFRAGSAEIDVRTDQGEVVPVKLGPDTQVQRVAPGEKDLKKAANVKVTDLVAGDRVLVSFVPGLAEPRRIVVMPATDIEKRREADRQDWIERGLGGVVVSVKGNDITLRKTSLRGQVISTVTAGEKTVFRRYAPDSVKFSDAKQSSLAEVRPGDQLRGRGQKSPDGLKVAADEVVFGTFMTKAGSVTAVDAEANELTVKDLETNKSIAVKLTADSQIKRLPNLMGMGGGGFQGRGAAAGAGAGARPGGPPDLAQMLERMPASTLSDLKTGETVMFSSTRGASSKQFTAIILLSNAEPLVQMAAAQSRAGQQGPGMMGGTGMGMGMGGMTGINGMELPGMIP